MHQVQFHQPPYQDWELSNSNPAGECQLLRDVLQEALAYLPGDTNTTARAIESLLQLLPEQHDNPGPTYNVWIAEREQCDARLAAWTWLFDAQFTCNDDPDGRGARQSAHAYARYLRRTFHCAFIAVRRAELKQPLPIQDPI
jgi:hypothetical protein